MVSRKSKRLHEAYSPRARSFLRRVIPSAVANCRSTYRAHGTYCAGSLVGSIDSRKTHHWENVFKVDPCTHYILSPSSSSYIRLYTPLRMTPPPAIPPLHSVLFLTARPCSYIDCVYKHHAAFCIDVYIIIFNFPPSNPVYIHL